MERGGGGLGCGKRRREKTGPWLADTLSDWGHILEKERNIKEEASMDSPLRGEN